MGGRDRSCGPKRIAIRFKGSLFPYHLTTTQPWGLSPLEDQQLGGLIMWVPGGLAYLAAALWAMARWLSASGRGRALERS